MAKGFEVNQARVGMLASFGKDLARRARSKCELCETAGVALSICEVSPVSGEPEFERCVFLCETCQTAAENPKKIEPGEQWRCLSGAVWSEVPAIQVLAVRLLRRQADSQDWARDAIEEVYLQPEIEEWALQD